MPTVGNVHVETSTINKGAEEMARELAEAHATTGHDWYFSLPLDIRKRTRGPSPWFDQAFTPGDFADAIQVDTSHADFWQIHSVYVVSWYRAYLGQDDNGGSK